MDKEIIKMAMAGNIEAFGQIVKSLEDDLLRIALIKMKNIEDAEDVLQNTIFIAFKKINTLKNVDYFKTWIIKILINESNRVIKSNIKMREISKKIQVDETPSSSDLEKIEIKSIINKLNDEDKLILELYYRDRFTSKEISKLLNISINTVKSKILRARHRIKKEMEE